MLDPGLEASHTVGKNGYDVHNHASAVFLANQWPRDAVWNKLWDYTSADQANASFSFPIEYTTASIRKPHTSGLGTAKQEKSNIIVKIEGFYGVSDWGVRDAFMHDLLDHHYGDGGVYKNMTILTPFGGFPGGWWVANDTWIRNSKNKNFWINVKISD